MTSFAKYYHSIENIESVSMENLSDLLKDESNKNKIADLIYLRYYNRYLKIFFFSKDKEFTKLYKNGFVMLASCCLVIETISSFLVGSNQTPNGTGEKTFERVFEKAEQYHNPLSELKGKKFSSNIRNAILHQGETYNSFKIRRDGQLYNASTRTINASDFCIQLDNFLKSYCDELKSMPWDSEIWDNCRVKLRHIIKNSTT